METCGSLLPTFDGSVTPQGGLFPCLRRSGHSGDHICLLANNKYLLWAFEACEDCISECECFIHQEIEKEEVILIIKK